jgi:hypothetical protein
MSITHRVILLSLALRNKPSVHYFPHFFLTNTSLQKTTGAAQLELRTHLPLIWADPERNEAETRRQYLVAYR